MAKQDGSIRILVGAAADRSVNAVFGDVERRAELAARNINRVFGAGASRGPGNAMARSFQEGAKASEKATRDVEKEIARQNRIVEQGARERTRFELRAARERERAEEKAARTHERLERERTRETARAVEAQIREQERAAAKIDAAHQRIASRTSHRAVRFLFPNPIGAFGMASRIGHDLLSGAGVDLSIAGSVRRSVEVNAAAAELSNRGFIEGDKGANGRRVGTAQLENEARGIARGLALDPHEILGAQNKFVGLTGDLELARKISGSVAGIAGAFGSSQEETFAAAGELANHLVGMSTEEKAQALPGLLRQAGQQGKIGAVDFTDFAKYIARTAAAAPRYAGSVTENISKLNALAEIAKKEGGAASAAEAFGSITSFTNTFQKLARQKTFHRMGVTDADLFEMDKQGHKLAIKDPFEIIKKVLEKSHGDLTKFFNAFPEVRGSRAVAGLQAIYQKHGGGAEGLAAVTEELEKFKNATMSAAAVDEANANRMQTDAAKAQEFQNALDAVVNQTKGSLLPALQELQPTALKAAGAFSQIVTFAAKNPGEAVSLAIAGAVARAGLESVFREGIERMVKGGLKVEGGAVMTVAGTIAIASAIVAMAETKKVAKMVGSDKDPLDLLMGFKGGEFSFKNFANDFYHPGEAIKRRVAVVGDIARKSYNYATEPTAQALTPQEYDNTRPREDFRADRFNRAQLSDELLPPSLRSNTDFAHAVTSGMRGAGPLQVVVTNASEIGGNRPVVSGHGRQSPAGQPGRYAGYFLP